MTGSHPMLKHGTLPTIMGSLLTAGMIGSFSLLWSMSHSLTRIGDKIELLSVQATALDAALSSTNRELVLIDRRLLLLEQRVGGAER